MSHSILKISFCHSEDPVVRRADWRFLLDNPTPQKSIVFEEGLLADAVSMISMSTVAAVNNYSGNDCDLAVAVNPTEKLLAAINSSLKPGGTSYLEWQVNDFFHTSTIIDKLRSSGFDYIKLYLPKPEPDRIYTNIWIPIDCKSAVEFAVIKNFSIETNNRFKQSAKIMRYLLWKVMPNLLTTYPYFLGFKRKYTIASIASKCIPAPHQMTRQDIHYDRIGNKMNDGNLYRVIDTTIKKEWRQLGLESNPDKISTLMLCNEGKKDKVILYIFADENRTPSLVVKIPRTKDSIPVVSIEARNIASLQAGFPDLEEIPRALFCIDNGALFAKARSYVDGVPLIAPGVVNERNRRDISLRVTSWLIEFARNTTTDAPPDWRESLVDPVLSILMSLFSSKLSPEQLQETRRIVSQLSLSSLVWEHRDLNLGNIILDHDRKVGLIDWEFARPGGLPAADLICFLTNLNARFEKPQQERDFGESYRNMLDISTPAGSIFNECIELYLSELNISKSEIGSIRLLTWLIQLYRRVEERYKLVNPHQKLSLPLNLQEDITSGLWEVALWKVELETQ